MANNRYYRKSTSITISTFYEQFQLDKYRLDPPYQRDLNVWSQEQKSFLMDTIFKNFPIPPIFLEQKIDSETGITNYDVIDGKQRLSTIIDFIENKVPLPDSFGSDIYGNQKINEKYFNDIKKLAKEDEDIKDMVANFWAYSISIEYIENPDTKIVDNIFDRLNREGSRLNPQELRKAQYYDTLLYNDIISYRNNEDIKPLISKLNKNRMEDVGFITELYIMTFTYQVNEGKETEIDKIFCEIEEDYDEKKSEETKKLFEKILVTLKNINLDYSHYNIEGVSHLYALWFLSMKIVEKDESIEHIKTLLVSFFEDLRSNRKIPQVLIYQQSMQSASRSKSSRKKRINALLDYLGMENL